MNSEFTYSLQQIAEAANWLKSICEHSKIWCISGEMGSGKTTLIKAVGEAFGIEEDISSPTYSLVNEYKTVSGKTIFHFDLYRLKKLEELLEIGVFDYFDTCDFCWIEWPEIAQQILEGEDCIRIEIRKAGEKRTVRVG